MSKRSTAGAKEAQNKPKQRRTAKRQQAAPDAGGPASSSSVAGFQRTAGRPRFYETPDALGDKFDEFLQWRDENPLQGVQVLKTGEVIQYDIRRPLTVEGFCRFAGFRSFTFREYEARPEFADVCQGVRDAICADQLEAALANQVNPMIAARVLKLRDGADITSNGQQIAIAPQTIHLTYNGADFTITPEDLDE